MWFPRRLLFVVAANSAFQMPQPTRRRSLRRVDAAPPPRTAMSASAVATGSDENGDHTETAATATSFAGRAALVMPFVAATAALARAGFPLYGAASPVLVLVHRFLKPDGEPFVERTVKLLALASVWAYWSAGVAYLLLYVLFQLPLTSYHALAVYVPLS